MRIEDEYKLIICIKNCLKKHKDDNCYKCLCVALCPKKYKEESENSNENQ